MTDLLSLLCEIVFYPLEAAYGLFLPTEECLEGFALVVFFENLKFVVLLGGLGFDVFFEVLGVLATGLVENETLASGLGVQFFLFVWLCVDTLQFSMKVFVPVLEELV